MDFKVSDILRQMASDFADLAEKAHKWEEWQKGVNNRLSYIEEKTERNQNALKDAANAILSKFN